MRGPHGCICTRQQPTQASAHQETKIPELECPGWKAAIHFSSFAIGLSRVAPLGLSVLVTVLTGIKLGFSTPPPIAGGEFPSHKPSAFCPPCGFFIHIPRLRRHCGEESGLLALPSTESYAADKRRSSLPAKNYAGKKPLST
jgi:hypothetical protein